MIARFLVVLTLLLGPAAPAWADEFKPAYFRVKHIDAETYSVMWKVPALDEQMTLGVKPVLPLGTEQLGTLRSSFAAGASVMHWTIRVPGGLEGKAVEFTNLSRTRLVVLARYERADGSEQVARILPVAPRFNVEASPGPYEVVQAYTVLGIEHILTGFDHLCFVLALVLIVRGRRQLLWTVTAFTVAHSITMALATLGFIHVPGPPVEAAIALSIVFVASEIVQQERGRVGLAAKKPWLIAFAFGLLHGLGFAGALAEVGLPANSIPLALLFFNIGVEIGQLLFIAAVLASMQLLSSLATDRVDRRRLTMVSAYLIGGVASYWAIERVSGFWS